MSNKIKSHALSPVVRAPAGVQGLHEVEGVDVAGVLRGVLSAPMHHLPVDQDHSAWTQRDGPGLRAAQVLKYTSTALCWPFPTHFLYPVNSA